MRKILINFGSKGYEPMIEKTVKDGVKFGADEVRVYDDLWFVKQPFYEMNKWLWDIEPKIGFGYYSWKYYILWYTMQTMEKGDIVMYADGDTYPVANFSVLFDICNKDGIMLFAAENWKNNQWCSKDCYVVMDCDKPQYKDVQAGCARYMLLKKGDWKSEQFLMEMITYSINKLTIVGYKSMLKDEDRPPYIEHRWEQAILTNLAIKHGFKLYREPDGGGEMSFNQRDRDLYELLFLQENKVKNPGLLLGNKYFNIESR